jgi:hypothetical protein
VFVGFGNPTVPTAKRLCHIAQGCRAAATLGNGTRTTSQTLKGFHREFNGDVGDRFDGDGGHEDAIIAVDIGHIVVGVIFTFSERATANGERAAFYRYRWVG